MVGQFNLSNYVAHPISLLLEGAWHRTLNALAVWEHDAYAKVREVFTKCLQCRCHVGIARNQNNLIVNISGGRG